jgi:hypothetical protein
VAAIVLIAGSVARADDASEARRHAQRASALAASGKCKQAVAEFDKAMAILRDPALLFNRGECHRKLGDNEAALEDYRQFLSDLPKAPNRAAVEKRIAELTGKPPASAGKASAPAATSGRSSGARAVVEAPVAEKPVAEPVAPRAVAPPREEATPAASSREIILTPPLPASEAVGSDAPGTGLTTTVEEKASAPDAPASSSEGGLTSRPWFWVAVAAVAVGVGVGTFIVLNRDGTTVPSSALGNYKF